MQLTETGFPGGWRAWLTGSPSARRVARCLAVADADAAGIVVAMTLIAATHMRPRSGQLNARDDSSVRAIGALARAIPGSGDPRDAYSRPADSGRRTAGPGLRLRGGQPAARDHRGVGRRRHGRDHLPAAAEPHHRRAVRAHPAGFAGLARGKRRQQAVRLPARRRRRRGTAGSAGSADGHAGPSGPPGPGRGPPAGSGQRASRQRASRVSSSRRLPRPGSRRRWPGPAS